MPHHACLRCGGNASRGGGREARKPPRCLGNFTIDLVQPLISRLPLLSRRVSLADARDLGSAFPAPACPRWASCRDGSTHRSTRGRRAMRDGRSDPGRPPMATRRAAALLRGGLGLAGGRPDAPPGRSRYNRFDAFQGPPSGGCAGALGPAAWAPQPADPVRRSTRPFPAPRRPPSAFSRAIDYDADHVLRRGPLPAALSRGAFTRPPLPASAVRAAAPRSRTAVTDDQSWPRCVC